MKLVNFWLDTNELLISNNLYKNKQKINRIKFYHINIYYNSLISFLIF